MAEIDMKTVVALSRGYEDRPALQLNAVGHLAQGLGRQTDTLRLAEYQTADGQNLGALAWWPLILLSGRATKVADFWRCIRDRDWPRACFVETMVQGGSAIQVDATAQLRGEALPIVAVAVHGAASELDALTRKLSLWKAPSGWEKAPSTT